ncbi:MAG: 50S ribosomal protein L25 [Candidatus Pacebacteria bacterium]|nr:50S ribosomal protein L25 [Candidatus Paceibacterota bacterium]MCF7856983.1 50S ribosomal protein L25 [Candidatus Paceibacterota bacterium]
MTFSLNVETRTERGKQLGKLRNAGRLPAVMYGPKEDTVLLTVDKIAFEKLVKKTGESSVITLEGLSSPKEVLVRGVAFDPLRGGVIHVDFYAIEAGQEITVDIPLEFVGEVPAVKLGGTLTKVLHEVEVTCMPINLPQRITVDVTVLTDFEKQIHVKDLLVPANVKIENDPEEVVALVQAVEEESEEPTVVDMDAIEVEKKGKTEEASTGESK